MVWKRFVFLVLISVVALPIFTCNQEKRLPPVATPSWRPPTRMKVDVIGRDFQWHFRVVEPPDWRIMPQGSGESTALEVPVGTRIDLRVESSDYIYRCASPDLRIDQIAVPGLVNTCSFTPQEVGEFPLVVDPICGFRLSHGDVMGTIFVRETHRDISGLRTEQ